MLKNYFLIALRNVRKHKAFSLINVTGLAADMSVCKLILLWVQDELSFDRFHEHTGDIYRVISEVYTSDHTSQNARTPNPLGPKVMNMAAPVGKRIYQEQYQARIIGGMRDFHQSLLHKEIELLIFRISEEDPHISARIHPHNMDQTIALIEKTNAIFERRYSFAYDFYCIFRHERLAARLRIPDRNQWMAVFPAGIAGIDHRHGYRQLSIDQGCPGQSYR